MTEQVARCVHLAQMDVSGRDGRNGRSRQSTQSTTPTHFIGQAWPLPDAVGPCTLILTIIETITIMSSLYYYYLP